MSRSYTEIFVSGKGGRAAVEVSSYGRGRYATATQVTDQLVAAVARSAPDGGTIGLTASAPVLRTARG